MDVCCECYCVVRSRSLRRADHSSRGVLPIVARRCVWSRNLKNEEAMTRVGPQRHRQRNYKTKLVIIFTICITVQYLCTLPTQRTHIFHAILRTKKQQFPIQHWQFHPSNGNSMCFLWGRKWNFISLWNVSQPCHDSRCQPPTSHLCGPGSVPGKYVQYLWWTNWHCDTLLSENFDPSLLTLTTISHTYLHINNLLLTKDKRVRPDNLQTEGTLSPEIGGGGHKELKMLLLFKIANKTDVLATKVHVIHPTKL